MINNQAALFVSDHAEVSACDQFLAYAIFTCMCKIKKFCNRCGNINGPTSQKGPDAINSETMGHHAGSTVHQFYLRACLKSFQILLKECLLSLYSNPTADFQVYSCHHLLPDIVLDAVVHA